MLSLVAVAAMADDPADRQVGFNRDVRPILADKCFGCHGPDAAARQADLDFSSRATVLAPRGDLPAIEPGHPEQSELMRRVTAEDSDERMPPADSGLSLSSAEIEVLRKWIASGARYEAHWAFIPPRRARLPVPLGAEKGANPIDLFVLERLRREGLRPNPSASPATLLRRVTLDLTGLPPTLSEIDAFERDWQFNPELAYQRLVDRLLASPAYGERMALDWLDAARYADTNGYFTDNDRTMWPWRDWVIDAFNANLPFDQFTIEQLAGDLLPEATLEQRIATGFNRNHMVNNETGIIEEEFRVEYVVDRADTTATVWMGLTFGCARCHDHKYDPISQRDFYRFYAFFNNLPERGLSGSSGNSQPFLKVLTPQYQQRLDQAREAVVQAEQEFAAVNQQLGAALARWEPTALQELPPPPTSGLVARFPFEAEIDAAWQVGTVPTSPGFLGQAAKFQDGAHLAIPGVGDFEADRPFSFGTWVRPQGAGCIISKMDDAAEMRGFDLTLRKGKAIVNLVHRWNQSAIRVVTRESIPSGQWQHLFVTYDGSGQAGGVRVFRNGKILSTDVVHDHLNETIRNGEPLRLGRRQASASLSGLLDEVRIYDRELKPEQIERLASYQLVQSIVRVPSAERPAADQQRLRDWFLEHRAESRLSRVAQRLARLRRDAAELARAVPTTMIMQEAPERREAYVLERGQYDQPTESVSAGMPDFLMPGSAQRSGQDEPNSRLQLARWLVDPAHPLTARVTVNRLWQQLFGTGLVATADDFGTQGERPSHPELLDWLALELIESGWDLKHVLRLIVSSRTYRQSANATTEAWQRDRDNRLLARGPRFRLSAETVRDQALAVSGLLVTRLGGPSVKPYQPDGLWLDVTYDSDAAYQADTGASLYRRSLYTFWKRQAPPPNMRVFDAPTRETCTVQRSRTNTPLQALVLMNDPTFVEASRKLAERGLLRTPSTRQEQIEFLFRSVTARRPEESEAAVLKKVFEQQRAHFADDRRSAWQLLSVGESGRTESLDAVELAAWTAVASLILSLDETIMKP